MEVRYPPRAEAMPREERRRVHEHLAEMPGRFGDVGGMPGE